MAPNPGLYKKFLAKLQGFLKPKYKRYQSTQTYPCEGPEGQPATLKPYVIDAPLYLIERHLLMQWQTQIYIPHFSEGPLLI